MKRRSFFGVIGAAVAAVWGVRAQPCMGLDVGKATSIAYATFGFGGDCTYVQARKVKWRGKVAWWVSFVIDGKPNVDLLLTNVTLELLLETHGKQAVRFPAMWLLGWLSREQAYALDYQGEWADSQGNGYLQHGMPMLTAAEARWIADRA